MACRGGPGCAQSISFERPGLTDAQIGYKTPQQFGALFKGQELEDALLTTFLNRGNNKAGLILDHNGIPYPVGSNMGYLQDFIREGIKKGSFEGQTREYEVATGKPFPAFTISPQDLVATEFAGLTATTGKRSGRQINLIGEDPDPSVGRPPYVHLLVHEACHFYVSDHPRPN